MKLERGTVIVVTLDPARGHEQRGVRPAIVVSASAVTSAQRYPLLAVVPVSGTLGEGALYPVIAPGRSGLTKMSCALIDNVRCIDRRRVCRIYGRISATELSAIDRGLAFFLGLERAPRATG